MITAESGKTYTYQSHHKEKRNVRVQCKLLTAPNLAARTTRNISVAMPTPAHHTPTKVSANKGTVHNLPGKRLAKKNPVVVPETTVNLNQCSASDCGILFKSNADKNFAKKNGKKAALWVGCDTSGCTYWGHAMCFKLNTNKTVKEIKATPFLCPAHS